MKLFQNLYQRATLGSDLVAGVTLAAVAIPECMGYTKIVGTPVVTGLYTILLPIAAFALLGSSRHLVVGADSATAAILFAGLLGIAQPYSGHWLALTSAAALITGGFLFLASILRLGFLADFLSRTVLVGFLSGVGVSLIFGQLPDMLGIEAYGSGFFQKLLAMFHHLREVQTPTLLMAVGVLSVILLAELISRKIPGSLVAVVLAIAVTWVFDLERFGITVVGAVKPGFPRFGLPHASVEEMVHLIPICASMFLVIVAQSAATARSFAQRYNEPLSANQDLVALGAANLLGGISSTFVVNGSPTKTAVVFSAGGRTQLSQLTTAGVTAIILLVATGLIARLPIAALAALVFLIGVHLVDLKSLRQIYRFRKRTYAVALATLLAVVFLGVERGIFVAVGLSILDHMEQEYHPKDIVLCPEPGHWKTANAEHGVESEPGLLVYRFQAPLFFANVDYFTARVQKLVRGAPHPVRLLVLDLISMADIDYTAGLSLDALVRELKQQGLNVACAQCDDVRRQLDLFGVTEQVGPDHLFETVQDALVAFHRGV